ncbi:uncharacterized protein FIBRA_08673 [Fibroporia radiculosa]|uniref:NADAR domain-containing protein n=1 Tax=Fibroporia radiculosa TaxID=599839 RepID=J4I356_9APHY|nr:uncharacterized protein FIBRA_08673 [Fibroporia radiculosa]CCM06412.1 predicted protein [Fibroporia radiculosa]
MPTECYIGAPSTIWASVHWFIPLPPIEWPISDRLGRAQEQPREPRAGHRWHDSHQERSMHRSSRSETARHGSRANSRHRSPLAEPPSRPHPQKPPYDAKLNRFSAEGNTGPPASVPVRQEHRQAPISFYHKHRPFYEFTNFSPHSVKYDGRMYPTGEHLFQSFKFQRDRPLIAEHIRTCSDRPSVALSEARRFQHEVRADWFEVNVKKMDEVLYHKFTQHEELKNLLLRTGDAPLVEDSDKDAFWGIGADKRGRNELGKALERLRSRLRV